MSVKRKRKIKKKFIKKVTFVGRMLTLFLTILSLVLFGMIFFLKILPNKFLVPIIMIYIFILLVIWIFQFGCKSVSIKFTFIFVSIFLIIVNSIGINYLWHTYSFMDKIGASEYQLESYNVVVLNDTYKSISEIDNSLLGVYSNDDNYISALNELDKKIDFKKEVYANFIDASNALLNGDIDVLFISQTHKDMADEQVIDFNKLVTIIDTKSVKVENEVTIKKVDITRDSFNVYISGIDVYGDISSVSRSDVNMIATINPNTYEVLLTSIPRDYYVQLHGTSGYKDKLTHAGIYGIDMSISTIEDLLDIDINYYVRVNFTTLISLVDSIGGIDIYSDKEFIAHTNNSCKYELGNNHLDGKCSLAFARERYAYKEGDRHRVENQQAVISAILGKTLSSKTLVTKYTGILKSLGSSFQTNIPQDQIYSLVNLQLDKTPSWNIDTYSLDGTDSRNYTYSYSGSKLYVMEPDYKTVIEASRLIDNVMLSE